MNESKLLQREDAKDLMKNSLFVAKDYWQLKTQLKNNYILWKLYTGDDSYIANALEVINDHISKNQPTYLDFIKNQANFIVSFVHIIHFRMQSFFKSCVIAKDVDDIRFGYLNFGDLLRSIEMQTYQIVVPNWFKIETLKSEKKKPRNNKRDADDDFTPQQRKSKPIINEAICPACSLIT